jgi:hypothetical protein
MAPIYQQDVEFALDQIELHGMPPIRRSTMYCLIARSRHYPPKEVLRLAHRHRHGKEPVRVHGGEPTNRPLQDLAFKVEMCTQIPQCQSWIKERH